MTNDAVECEKCGGELEIGLVWDRCLKCGHLQDPHFENELAVYRHQNRKHGHYYKDVSKLKAVDVYMVCKLFGVNDAAISHAVKKLLCSGQRGYKDAEKDIREAIDTLQRYIEIESELGGNDGI